MATGITAQNVDAIVASLAAAEEQWYAVRTRCRWEKKVSEQLQNKSIETLLPTYRRVHRWSDRRKTIELAMLPGYVFVRLSLTAQARLAVLQTFGVTSFIVFNGKIPPIPVEQIEQLRRLSDNNIPCSESDLLQVGQRVRIHGGCLDGLECVLVSRQGEKTLVLQIESIQRAIRIPVDDYRLEMI